MSKKTLLQPIMNWWKSFLYISFIASLSVSSSYAADAKSGYEDPENWPRYHRLDNGWRFSPLKQVNKSNVKNLSVAWIHTVGDIANGMQATPIVIDGVIYYVGPNNNVFAVDGASGKTIWHYQPELDPIVDEVFYTNATRGVTVGHGNVYLGTLDGRYIALDQKTGEVKWENQIIKNQREEFGILFSSPPQLAGDILYGGTTGGDQPQPGRIFAANAITGETAWTFQTIQMNKKESWPGDSGKVGGGGAWLPGQYDAASDTIYIGTSNAAPDFYNEGREGDNKYAASYLAIEGKTGKLKAYHQEVPNDQYDYDSAYEGVFINHNGKDLIVHLNKGGHVFVYEKDTLKLHNVWEFAENINWVEKIDPKTGELIGRVNIKGGEEKTFCPYLLGARSWNHSAYNPESGLWYSNAQEACNTVTSGPTDPAVLANPSASPAALSLGVSAIAAHAPPGKKASARLDARNPITGEVKWTIPYKYPGYGSVMTTAGGLVFNGDPEGMVYAYDADNGKKLWQFNTGSGLRAGIVSYMVGGKQYILVPNGWGSLAPGFAASAYPGIADLPGGSSIIAFTLD
jgi:alcohol dehydrogenase (cytochrome c)